MTDDRRWQRRALSGLSVFVALEFILIAPFKFFPEGVFGYPPYSERFAEWGYPPWFAIVVGVWEVAAGLLLLFPRRRFLGATIIVFVLTGAVTTHIVNHDPFRDSISASIHLVLAAVIALAYWPADWREPLSLRAIPSRR
jgi:uncharacterized membrane protein YphA (DoxX/SURF4 family)